MGKFSRLASQEIGVTLMFFLRKLGIGKNSDLTYGQVYGWINRYIDKREKYED